LSPTEIKVMLRSSLKPGHKNVTHIMANISSLLIHFID